MDDNWQKQLDLLNQYIYNHPRLQIGRSAMSIPDDIRSEFYDLFRRTQENMVKSRYGGLLAEAETLSRNYLDIESRVSRAKYNPDKNKIPAAKRTVKQGKPGLWRKITARFSLGGFKFEDISLDAKLDEFLHEPLNAFSRMLFDPLFELLQGKIEAGAFEKLVDDTVEPEFHKLYKSGYEKWLVLSLLKALNTESLFRVVSDEISPKALIRQEVSGRDLQANLPAPTKIGTLAFSYGRNVHVLSTVDILVHSRQSKKYVGIKTKYETAAHSVAGNITQRPSLPYETVREIIKESPILIYTGDRAQDASLVADKKKFWCPDMIIDIKETTDSSAADTIPYSELKPTFGTVIIPLPTSAQKPADSTGGETSVLYVGFDKLKLNSIVNKIR